VYSGYQKVADPAIQEKFEKAWNAKLSPKVGLTIVEIMHAAGDGKIKGLVIMGENPMVSDPDINHVEKSLKNLDFLVCLDIFQTETTELADVVLPVASFAEKTGTYTNTERRVLPIRPFLKPVGESKPDWWVIQELAKRMGASMEYTSTDDLMKEINQLTPSYAGISPHRLVAGAMLQWPCPTADHPGTPFLHKDKFTKGKGTFFPIDYIPSKESTDKEYPFVLSTGRILYHYHTGTMTRKTRVLPEYEPGPYVEIHPNDLHSLKVADGEMVKVTSRRGTIDIQARETERVAPGTIFIPFHFAEAAANRLTIDALDPVAKIPEFKVCAVNIQRG
jgi:predicted molibdopterin-dependent oxidoreductase YjgC